MVFAHSYASGEVPCTGRWVALQASAAEVAVVGLDGLNLEASGIMVDINLVSGLQDGEVAAKRVVDFQRKSLGVVTGTGTTSTLTLDGAAGERVRAFLRRHGVQMVDCQQETGHLASLGAAPIPRSPSGAM